VRPRGPTPAGCTGPRARPADPTPRAPRPSSIAASGASAPAPATRHHGVAQRRCVWLRSVSSHSPNSAVTLRSSPSRSGPDARRAPARRRLVEGLAPGLHVGGDQPADPVALGLDPADLPARAVEQLAQVPPAHRVHPVGPEQEDQLVAGDPTGAERQVGQELIHLVGGEVRVPAVQVQSPAGRRAAPRGDAWGIVGSMRGAKRSRMLICRMRRTDRRRSRTAVGSPRARTSAMSAG
jgi:hypothetical protein